MLHKKKANIEGMFATSHLVTFSPLFTFVFCWTQCAKIRERWLYLFFIPFLVYIFLFFVFLLNKKHTSSVNNVKLKFVCFRPVLVLKIFMLGWHCHVNLCFLYMLVLLLSLNNILTSLQTIDTYWKQ